MSTYSVKGKGWRYDFTLNGRRYTNAWYKTKREAIRAENERRKELQGPEPMSAKIPIDMDFLTLINRRMDYLKDRTTSRHCVDSLYRARVWVEWWGGLSVEELSQEMIEKFLVERKQVSTGTANTELKCLKALFNFAIKRKWISANPAAEIEFYPVNKRRQYTPPLPDIEKVIAVADPDTQDYLILIQDTLARVGEINRLVWDDVSFLDKTVTLYTRKKRDRSPTPRRVPMTERVFEILTRRFEHRDAARQWVFWHRYWSRSLNRFVYEPFKSRNKLMARLCRRAGVRHFSFHAFRRAGASVLEQSNVPVGTVQKLLGHEDISTTQIYLQTLSGSERQAVEILEAQIRKSHTDSHTESNGAVTEPHKSYVN